MRTLKFFKSFISKMFFIICLIFTLAAYCSGRFEVAIVGGGIGGSSCAYHLKNFKGDLFNIDLFEPNKIGGRLSTVEYNGYLYENGGSVIHSRNYLMKSFVKKFGLQAKEGCVEDFALFNGTKMLFKSSHYDIITAAKLWWRYGYDINRLDDYTTNMINSFQRIYGLKCPYNSTEELLNQVDKELRESFKISSYEGFKLQGFSSRFIEEILSSIIRCNYCQSLNVHLFVGSVAVAGAGANLWSVKGGNWQVAQELIKASGATVLNERVLTISKVLNSPKLLVSTASKTKLYDYVIVATPLTEEANITFLGFGPQPKYEEYHKTVCTLIKGEINVDFFKSFDNILPEAFFFTDEFEFNAISLISPVEDDCSPDAKIWKIFSNSELTDSQIEQLFLTYQIISVKNWLAYPKYKPVGVHKSFFVFPNHTNLLYVNAIESLASAMEMSAIGGRNVANLIKNEVLSTEVDCTKSDLFVHDEL